MQLNDAQFREVRRQITRFALDWLRFRLPAAPLNRPWKRRFSTV
jgi:hypothetical protein